jgi:hypothetical protein
MPAGSADCGPSKGGSTKLLPGSIDWPGPRALQKRGVLAVRLLPHDDAKLQFARWPSVGIRILLKRNAVFA